MESFAALLVGVALLVAQWVLPMMYPHLPDWVQIVLLCAAGALLVIAAILPFVKRKKGDDCTQSDVSFSQNHSGPGDNNINF